MPTQTPPVRPSTIKKFIKESTQMRVAADATNEMVHLITAMSEQMAVSAAQSALDGQRTTIMASAIQEAFKSFLGDSGASLLNPATIHSAIDGISNESFKELLKLLRADLVASP